MSSEKNGAQVTAPVQAKILYDRDFAEVRRMRIEGSSWRKIGEHFGVTGQRVHQLFAEDITEGGAKRVTRGDVQDDVKEFLETHGPVSRTRVCEKFGISSVQLSRMDVPRHLLLLSRDDNWRTNFTDEEIFEWIRKAAKDVGEPLTTSAYLKWYEDNPQAISLAGITLRFGWTQACEASGVSSGKTRRLSYTRKWDMDQIMVVLSRFISDCIDDEVSPTYAEYERRQKSRSSWPSGSTIRVQAGMKWAEIIDLAARQRNGELGWSASA